MAADTTKGASKAKKEAVLGVTFKCRLCDKERPISQMKVINRFRPVVVVCCDCERLLR